MAATHSHKVHYVEANYWSAVLIVTLHCLAQRNPQGNFFTLLLSKTLELN